MPRAWLVALAVLVILHVQAAPVWAQQPPWAPVPFRAGSGFYLNWVKIAACWLTLFVWVSTTGWANIDVQRHRFGYTRWNAVMCFPFIAAFLLVFVIPYFFVSYPLLILAYFIPSIIYVRFRNSQLEPHERVMTPDHIRWLVAVRLNEIGFKVSTERRDPRSEGPPVQLAALGGATDRDNAANLLMARQMPGFVLTRELLSEAMASRADAIMMDFTQTDASARYQIDGVWHNADTRDRPTADAILEVVKQVAALKPAERRARQQGNFGAQVEKTKYTCRIVAQGTKTGERAIISLDDGVMRFKKIADLGMREKLQEQLKELMAQKQGVIVFSAPPSGGLTSLFDAAMNTTDRFVRSFIGAEDIAGKERLIENIPVETYDAAAGETPMTVLPAISRKYPDVIVCRLWPDAATVEYLCDQVAENRLIFGSIRAKDASEVLLRVLMLKVPPQKFAEQVTAVVNQRLIRKLCDSCKEAYPPPPQILKQLGIPAGKLEALYRPPQEPEKPCTVCNGLGYLGRTGFFELLVVDEAVRNTLIKTPKLDLVRQAARKAGMRTLQEEGLLLVVRGVTSLEELMRVLKE